MRSYAIAPETAVEERERLILDHLPQVRLIARRIQERLPETVTLDDLISAGVIGLIAAIDHFDPGHNVKLKTYAEYKIRGAILDSLRELDWAPRQKRRQAREMESAIAALEQRLHRAPLEEEIAGELGLSVEEYRERLIETRGLTIGALEYASQETTRDVLQFVPDSQDKLPLAQLERSELERLLARAIDGLPQAEQTVLGLYFQEGMTLREIAAILKLHESRISQLKSQAILRIRAHIQKRWPAGRGR